MGLTFKPKVVTQEEIDRAEAEKRREPTAEEIMSDTAQTIARTIFDKLTFVGDQAVDRIKTLLPEILRAGFGLEKEYSSYGSKPGEVFKFIKTNGFRGALEEYIAALANKIAAENVDDALENKLLAMIRPGGAWCEQLCKDAKSSYEQSYSNHVKEHIRRRVTGAAERLSSLGNADVVNESEFVKALDDITQRLSMPHVERVKVLTKAAKEALVERQR